MNLHVKFEEEILKNHDADSSQNIIKFTIYLLKD